MWATKAKEIALGLLATAWAVITPIHIFLYIVIGLVFLDLVTGVWKAVRLGQFSSHKMRDTPIKLVPYLLVILAGFGLDNIVGDTQGLYFARAFALLIGGTEVTSLAENMRDITGLDFAAIVRDKLKPPTKE